LRAKLFVESVFAKASVFASAVAEAMADEQATADKYRRRLSRWRGRILILCQNVRFFLSGNTSRIFEKAIFALHNYLLIRQLRLRELK
jgi:hypothetical protein